MRPSLQVFFREWLVVVFTIFILLISWTCLSYLFTDATSSLCSGLTSLSALVVTFLDPYFWWADSGTGGLVALYTLYKGTSTMIHSMVKTCDIFQHMRHSLLVTWTLTVWLHLSTYRTQWVNSKTRESVAFIFVLRAQEWNLPTRRSTTRSGETSTLHSFSVLFFSFSFLLISSTARVGIHIDDYELRNNSHTNGVNNDSHSMMMMMIIQCVVLVTLESSDSST